MTKVLSLDTSTSCTGYAVYEDGKYARCGCIDKRKEKLTSEQRLDEMCKDILTLMDVENPDIVYWETPSIARNAVTQRLLTMVTGVVYGWCLSHNVYHEDFRPNVWRKGCLKRDEKLPRTRVEAKQWSINRVKELYDADVNDDTADAIMIAYGAFKLYAAAEKSKRQSEWMTELNRRKWNGGK